MIQYLHYIYDDLFSMNSHYFKMATRYLLFDDLALMAVE